MAKYIYVILFILGSVILLPLFASSPVYADDPGSNLNVEIDIIGDNPDLGVNMYGDNPDVWINGVHLNQIAAQIGLTVGSVQVQKAISSSLPNSRYSGASTGFLPPLATNPGVAEVAPGKYTQPLVGWKGYFCPDSNLDPSVYHGSGCGGTWGVCDGYSDFWCRRQIAGLAPEFVIQQEKLNTVIDALANVIRMTENNNSQLSGDGGLEDLQNQTSELQGQITNLEEIRASVSTLENDYVLLESTVNRNAVMYTRQVNIVIYVFSGILAGLFAYIIFITLSLRRLRRNMK